MYFKVTNKDENHNGFQYIDGLNVIKDKFNDNPGHSCCAGGLYFTDIINIFKFLNYGIYLREVTLPVSQGKQSTGCCVSWPVSLEKQSTGCYTSWPVSLEKQSTGCYTSWPTSNTDFKMIKDKSDDKWRANMIILGKRYELFNVDTFKYLIKKGADIHADNDFALSCCAKNNYLDLVELLVEYGANVNADNDYALRLGAENGNLDIVKFLVENGANIHANDDDALISCVCNGYLDVVEYLVEKGADIHARDDSVIRLSMYYGHSKIHEFLKNKCSSKN